MHVRADQSAVSATCKEIKHARKKLERENLLAPLWNSFWNSFWLHTTMLSLNLVGLLYFIARIILYKIGWLKFHIKEKYPWRKRKRKKKAFQVHSTALNIDKRLQDQSLNFDTDASTIICDNSANVHICNDKRMFIGPMRRTAQHSVATIGGKKNIALGIGTVSWRWKDDNGKDHTIEVHDVLYFPKSPVNILSVTSLAEQFKDDEGTGIDTKRSKSRFYWQGKYVRTINHPMSNLPELPINEGFSLMANFSRLFSRKVRLEKTHCHCHSSQLIPSVGDTKSKLELSDDMFHVGETLLYTNAGHTTYVRIEKIFLDDDRVLRFVVRTRDDKKIETTKESLRAPDAPDIGWIPTTIPDKKEAATTLSEEDISRMTNPVTLSPLQEEFLALHERLWHLPFSGMFRLVKLGFLPKKFSKLGNKAPPCVSCIFGQAHRKPWRFKQTKDGGLSALRGESITKPGETVGIDQLISAQPGLVPQERGLMTRARIWAATVYICYVTGYIHVGLMTDQSGESTLQTKRDFEHLAMTRDVNIKHYHADNGRFAERSFTDDVKQSAQRITFCGVGAHHQNGITENAIKQLTLVSRTLLVHAQSHWPEYISTMFWPFALKAAQDRLNQLNVGLDGKTPDMKFSGVASMSLRLRDFHTFGCPCYVLDSRLQTNPMGVPKWEPRARLGIYLGRSPAHANNVALVLNPKTGLVSPQFHIVFDDYFTTVPHLRKGTVPPNWKKLVQGSKEKSTDEFFDVTKTWFQPTSDESADEVFLPVSNEGDIANEGGVANEGDIANEGDAVPSQSQVSEGEEDENDLLMPKMMNLETAGHRRSPRIATQEKKNYNFSTTTAKFCAFGVLIASSLTKPAVAFSQAQASANAALHQCNMINANFDGSINAIHHMALSVGRNNESYTFREMLKQDDAADFIKAMVKETRDHESRDHWDIIKRSQVPHGTKTIQAIWSFKRKRFPDGLLNKHKARLCAHGGMQQWGVNYWETYAPVVNWISVRFLLILSELAGLDSRTIDFVLAFPQAELDVPVYMELPIGMEVPGHQEDRKLYLLHLRRSLYGLKQASANWYDMLRKGLQIRGFKESVADPCVFIKPSTLTAASTNETDNASPASTAKTVSPIDCIKNFRANSSDIIVLVYVDDCIILSRDKSSIDLFIASLTHGPEKFAFTDEGTLDKYLGVEISRLPDGQGFKLTQPYLIERVLEAANIDLRMTNSRSTPAVLPLLSRDEEGPERKHDWKYRTLTGMLGYLQHTSRPDISMATHQCARFNANPKLCHERAVKRICKYLLGTMDKGIIFRPDHSKGLECHVDADFAGGWADGDSSNPESVLSRTGFIISYAGCPIYWCSKLQTEIALSTTESEYIALSQSMREVLPFLNLMQEIEEFLPVKKTEPKFFCTVWEDNRSCIKVAESPKFTPRTKHIALKYHHFRQFVSDKTVRINPIDTLEQNADILTKPLDLGKFEYLRKKICGW